MQAESRNSGCAFIYVVLIAAGLAGCGRQDSEESQTAMTETEVRGGELAQINGTVSYVQRMALTPDAELKIQLQDISRADAPATIIAEQKLTNPGQVPISFTIDYDPALIDERFTYSVRATLSDRGRVLFTSDTVTPVLTRDNGSTVDIRLVMVDGNQAAEQGSALTGTRWVLQAINGEPVATGAGTSPAYLKLNSDEYTVEGFSGCNQFSGSWAMEDERIRFGALAMTMRACIDGMETEQAYMQALKAMDRHSIAGDILRVYTAGAEVLTFRAQN